MKATLLALFVGLFMIGCGEPDLSDPEVLKDATAHVVDESKLQDRNGVFYLLNGKTPYTGRTELFYENGQKKREGNVKDGKQDGLTTGWHENGQKHYEVNFKDGKGDGLMTKWYDNGRKKEEMNYLESKLMSTVVWKPKGEKCPVTTLNDGNGVRVVYNEDGTEKGRYPYKDGELAY
jgi:antitoxin component YwqK of YwqJK toxin-antitoxin module